MKKPPSTPTAKKSKASCLALEVQAAQEKKLSPSAAKKINSKNVQQKKTEEKERKKEKRQPCAGLVEFELGG